VSDSLEFQVLLGTCGQLPVVVGFGSAHDLRSVSFADILDEGQETGYQRPCDRDHARAFRAYITSPGATTIPLTFNLRGGTGWGLSPEPTGGALRRLRVTLPRANGRRVMVQVDGQHRLGDMADIHVPLAFQCFLGLSARDEMGIFSTINSKARGLSSSLLDFHATKLAPRLEDVQLELYIAKTLNDDPASAWKGKVKLGGAPTQGTHRRVSLRGLQTATRELLRRSPLGTMSELSPLAKYEVVREYWSAVAETWPTAWARDREHLLVKGVGVNALALLGGELVTAALSQNEKLRRETFARYLSVIAGVDWTNDGPFKGFGGRHGADEVHRVLASKLWAAGIANHRAAG